MTLSLIIKNARIVDGTGRPSFPGDVGVAGDRIACIGRIDNANGIPEIDAGGKVVAPGFIELHTHYDPQLCWDRNATPAAEHGVTTVVTGNCGLSLAPVHPGQGLRLAKLFHRVEDLKPEVFEAAVPFAWESFGEFLDFIRPGLGVNVCQPVGHSALRLYVMGEDAQERPATDAELDRMCGLLGDAIDAGAFGLSMAYDHIRDYNGKPTASAFADLRERIALARTVARHGRCYVEVTLNLSNEDKRLGQYDELATIALESGAVCSAQELLDTPAISGCWRQELVKLDAYQKRGAHVYGQTQARPADNQFALSGASGMLYLIPVWRDVFSQPAVADRIRDVKDPVMRKAMIDNLGKFFATLAQYSVRQTFSARNKPYEGRHLKEIAATENRHMIDVMFDIALADDLETVFLGHGTHANMDHVCEMLAHPFVHMGGSDAGAHLDQFAGEGDSTFVLQQFVRNHKKFTLEDAVKLMTGDLARDWNIRNRGTLRPGNFADLVIFDPETVSRGDEKLVSDIPAGAQRYVRASTGIEATLVNGQVFFSGGKYTKARAGAVI